MATIVIKMLLECFMKLSDNLLYVNDVIQAVGTNFIISEYY